jgi:hemerythrin-like metal-binding protein
MKNNLYIIWHENNNLGISIIDEQHRGIISTINSLYHFIQSGQGEEIIKPTLIMLLQYTTIHFSTEEALMKEAGYPAVAKHIIMHKALLEKTRKLSIEANRDQDSDAVLSFLKDWWLGHITKEDKKYAPFLNALLE